MIGYPLVGRPAARRVVIVAASAVAALAGLAAPALAHAYLSRTYPAAGAVLREAPERVTLRFSEPVAVARRAVAVYDDRLRRVDRGDASPSPKAGDTVSVGLPPGLGTGTYTVVWRVVSDDSHPVEGTFAFSVGKPTPPVGAPPVATVGSRPVGFALGVARFMSYAGLAAGPGALVAILLLWPAGRGQRGARRIAQGGVLVLLAGTVAAYLLEGSYGAGVGISRTFSSDSLGIVAASHYGHVVLVRLYLVGALAIAAALSLRRPRRWADGVTVAVGLAVCVTFALAGHAAVGPLAAVGVAADTLHIAAMACWLGALAVLLAAIGRGDERGTAQDAAPAVSTLALAAVVTLAVTGVVQAVRQTGSLDALTSTTYGRLLLAKVAGLVLLTALGFFARRRVRRGAVAGRRFAAGIATEVAVAAAVLVTTSVLVASVPARTAYAPPVVRHLRLAGLRLDVSVTSPRVGVPLRISVRGARAALTGRLRLPSSGLVPVSLRFTGPSQQRDAAATVNAPGDWVLELTTEAVQAGVVTLATTVRVR